MGRAGGITGRSQGIWAESGQEKRESAEKPSPPAENDHKTLSQIPESKSSREKKSRREDEKDANEPCCQGDKGGGGDSPGAGFSISMSITTMRKGRRQNDIAREK